MSYGRDRNPHMRGVGAIAARDGTRNGAARRARESIARRRVEAAVDARRAAATAWRGYPGLGALSKIGTSMQSITTPVLRAGSIEVPATGFPTTEVTPVRPPPMPTPTAPTSRFSTAAGMPIAMATLMPTQISPIGPSSTTPTGGSSGLSPIGPTPTPTPVSPPRPPTGGGSGGGGVWVPPSSGGITVDPILPDELPPPSGTPTASSDNRTRNILLLAGAGLGLWFMFKDR
jgi:hypothetical protein